jgi:CRP/FNR family transcriptional regulator
MPANESRETPAARLRRLVPGMDAVAPGLVTELDANAAAIRRADGAVLFDEGESCPGLLVLERGAVRVSRVAPGGRELLLYRVQPGETCVLTLSCLLSSTSYGGRGVAEGEVDGVLVPIESFHRLTATSEAFRRFVFTSFAERIRGLLDLAGAVTFERLDQRLAAALLARVEREGRIELAVTHAELAAELGTVRERVSRLLEGFESGGAVELGRGRIRVRSKDALRDLASRAG